MRTIEFTRPERTVDTVFIHCSASDWPKHDSIDVVRHWHLDRGFDDVGYHFFISKDGKISRGRSLEKTPAAQKGHNIGSIAICLHGLRDFTEAQFSALRGLCGAINAAYGGAMRFRGHTEVSNKDCPVFDYRTVLDLDDNGHVRVSSALNTLNHVADILEMSLIERGGMCFGAFITHGDLVEIMQSLINVGTEIKEDSKKCSQE